MVITTTPFAPRNPYKAVAAGPLRILTLSTFCGFISAARFVNDYLLPNGEEKNYTNGITDNPRYFAEKSYLNSNLNRILANAKLAYEFTDWFNMSYQLGVDNYYDERYRFAPGDVDVGSATNGFIVREGINYNEITSNLYANFSKKISEDFNANLLLGNQISIIDTKRNTKRGEGLASHYPK